MCPAGTQYPNGFAYGLSLLKLYKTSVYQGLIGRFSFLAYFVTTKFDKCLELGTIGKIPAKYILRSIASMMSWETSMTLH